MKPLTACLMCLLFWMTVLSQSFEGNPLNLKSSAIKFCVTRDEHFFLATRAGEVAKGSALQTDWQRRDPEACKDFSGPLLDDVNFFNKDTGFVSGFISGAQGKYDIIYHTTDGGKNWRTINFGQGGWVDDAIQLDDGEAWLSVGGSGIAYTRDYGFTWQKLAIPEIRQRFATIYFNNRREGIIGSLWNFLAYTKNNCENWQLLPTPLDQKTYTKTNQHSRPDFKKLAIFSDYLLVCQEDMVFYSRRDSIHWVWMPGYLDFYTDPENSALFFQTTRSCYVRADEKLQPLFTTPKVEGIFSAQCKKGNLFLLSRDKILELRANHLITVANLSANPDAGFAPRSIGYTPSGSYGVRDANVYFQEGYQGAWKYLFTLPFSPSEGKLSIEDNQLLFDAQNDTLFYFSLSGKEISRKSKTVMVRNFCEAGIRRIVFRRGSAGCFHHYEDRLQYDYEKGKFGGALEESSGSPHTGELPDNDTEIDEATVEKFVSVIPYLFSDTGNASIQDLGFTSRDYQQCKDNIEAFRRSIGGKKKGKGRGFFFDKNNLDFDRLISLVDTIRNLDKARLKGLVLHLDETLSTTTNWTRMDLVNNKNETLSIFSYYDAPHAFYFPWVVTLNGFSRLSSSMEIHNFLDRVFPNFLQRTNKLEMLYAIVKQLY